MLKLPINDFIEEVKSELLCYEEIEEDKIKEWEEKFLNLVKDNKIEPFKLDKNMIVFKDESDILDLADAYWVCLETGEEDKYWKSFL